MHGSSLLLWSRCSNKTRSRETQRGAQVDEAKKEEKRCISFSLSPAFVSRRVLCSPLADKRVADRAVGSGAVRPLRQLVKLWPPLATSETQESQESPSPWRWAGEASARSESALISRERLEGVSAFLGRARVRQPQPAGTAVRYTALGRLLS